jgi:hypothetical protein
MIKIRDKVQGINASVGIAYNDLKAGEFVRIYVHKPGGPVLATADYDLNDFMKKAREPKDHEFVIKEEC